MSARVLALIGAIPLLGQERGNIEALRALTERGVDVLVVTHERYGNLHVQPLLDRLGIRWTRACYTGRLGRQLGAAGWILNAARIARANAQLLAMLVRYRPTHLYTCNPLYFVNFLPLLLLVPRPMIYRAGDLPAQHSRAYRLLWASVLGRRVARFVCISRFVADALSRAGVSRDKLEIIYNAPPRRSAGIERAPERRHRDGERATRFVCIGQLSEGKGVDLVIAAAIALCAEYPAVTFVLAGDLEYASPEVLAARERVVDAGLAARILFPGYVEDAPALLAASDVHLAPSRWEEALGNVVVEAKLAGIPSIVSSRGGLPELVTDGVDGTVCAPGSVDALIAAIRAYVLAPGLAARQGREAARSLERLGVGRFADDWLRVLERT